MLDRYKDYSIITKLLLQDLVGVNELIGFQDLVTKRKFEDLIRFQNLIRFPVDKKMVSFE